MEGLLLDNMFIQFTRTCALIFMKMILRFCAVSCSLECLVRIFVTEFQILVAAYDMRQ
jgi:hypothetical protein